MTTQEIIESLEEYFKKKIKKINLRTKICTGTITDLVRYMGNYTRTGILLIRIDTSLNDEINIALKDTQGIVRSFTINAGKCFIPCYDLTLQNTELNKSFQITYYHVIFET